MSTSGAHKQADKNFPLLTGSWDSVSVSSKMIMVLGEVPKRAKSLYKLIRNNGETRGEASLDSSVISLAGDPPVLQYGTEKSMAFQPGSFLIPRWLEHVIKTYSRVMMPTLPGIILATKWANVCNVFLTVPNVSVCLSRSVLKINSKIILVSF